jgi:hypothetical protein
MAMSVSEDGMGMSMGPPLSPRQEELQQLWSYYACQNYAGRKVDWSGRAQLSKTEHEYVASAGFIPPGFYDAGQSLPLKFRRPTAPYYLGRVIVDRFTSLLFSNRRHPQIVVEGDPDTEDFARALAEASRLWPQMIQARTYGGAMGSVGMSFKFEDGVPVVETHDPRWCYPIFENRQTQKLARLEIRYTFPDQTRGPKGEWVEAWFWFRRVIDDQTDTVWPKVPVGDGTEPDWDAWKHVQVEHGFGFCPAVWIQNLPVADSVDGDPDAHGAFDMIEAIDQLIAQAHKGTLANCDPTTVITTDADMDEVMKGSDNAIKVEKGGTASYMEMTGSGPKAAMDLVEKLEEYVLRVVRCYLDTNKTGGAKSVVEIERDYSSMLEKCDLLREQYGERGAKQLLILMVKAARKVSVPRIERDEAGTRLVRSTLQLPRRAVKEDGTGRATFVERRLGPSSLVTLKWPGYFQPSLDDALKAVQTATLAKTGGLIDDETAVQFIAEYFQVEDTQALLEKIRKMQAEMSDALEVQMMNRMAASAAPNIKAG